jgi:arylsulfatase A-like enzyme
MIRDRHWKYIHYNLFRPQLFDMQEDPHEMIDLGDDPAYTKVRADMQQMMLEARRRLKPRVGVPYENLAGMGPPAAGRSAGDHHRQMVTSPSPPPIPAHIPRVNC